MNAAEFQALLREQWTLLTAVSALVVLFGWSSWSILSLPRTLLRRRDDLAGAISESARGSTPKLSSRWLTEIVNAAGRAIRANIAGRRGDRIVLSTPLRTVLSDWAEDAKRSRAAIVWGSSYTGIALVFTFGLIAWVLFADIRHAISPGPGGEVQAGSLADAVAKMGFKFIISCAGILLAIGHAFVMRAAEGKLDVAVWKLEEALRPGFADKDAVHLELLDEQVRGLAAIQQSVVDSRNDAATRLDRLQAIEVSVKDLGAEVTASLNAMVQEALTEHIKILLNDIRGEAEKMAAKMEVSLEGNLTALGQKLVAALTGMERLLETQANAGLGQVLERIQDVVTGGFSSETRNMSGLLTDFQRVIPELTRELQLVAGTMGQVMQGLAAQQQEQQALVAGLATATTENVQRLTTDLARGGAQAMSQILQETNTRIDKMVATLDDASKTSAGRSSGISTDFEKVAARVAAVTQDLSGSTVHVRALMEHVQAALLASQKGIGQIADAASRLKQAADGMNATIEASDKARRRMEELLEKQMTIAERNARSLEHMDVVWPKLLKEVANTIQSTTGSMVQSWEALSSKLSAATAQYGQDVGEKVENLSDVVSILHETMKSNGRARS